MARGPNLRSDYIVGSAASSFTHPMPLFSSHRAQKRRAKEKKNGKSTKSGNDFNSATRAGAGEATTAESGNDSNSATRAGAREATTGRKKPISNGKRIASKGPSAHGDSTSAGLDSSAIRRNAPSIGGAIPEAPTGVFGTKAPAAGPEIPTTTTANKEEHHAHSGAEHA